MPSLVPASHQRSRGQSVAGMRRLPSSVSDGHAARSVTGFRGVGQRAEIRGAREVAAAVRIKTMQAGKKWNSQPKKNCVADGAFVSFILFAAMNIKLTTRGQTTRFDPAEFAPQDVESVHHLMELFLNETRPPALVDENGQRLELPRPVYELLVKVATAMQEGKVITLVPETQELTTQAAANLLGVSRPHIVKLIEDGKLPSHKVGAHRRIQMKDLLTFQRLRDKARHEALNELARRAQEAGLY